MISASRSYDVIILGSGIAGLAAALAAHELGLQPLVLEKAATLGGGTVHSYGLIWVGENHLAQAAGHGDTRDEVLAYLQFLGGGKAAAHLVGRGEPPDRGARRGPSKDASPTLHPADGDHGGGAPLLRAGGPWFRGGNQETHGTAAHAWAGKQVTPRGAWCPHNSRMMKKK